MPMNLPNKLTIVRIIMIPFFVFFLLTDFVAGSKWIATVLFCAASITDFLDGNTFCHTLLISPPGCGKTTYLRDIIRLLSDGTDTITGKNVAVVDERSEI